jgi:Carbohydrate phosphorylase
VPTAHFACVGSHTIDDVAQLHANSLRQTVLCDFGDLSPGKICRHEIAENQHSWQERASSQRPARIRLYLSYQISMICTRLLRWIDNVALSRSALLLAPQ